MAKNTRDNNIILGIYNRFEQPGINNTETLLYSMYVNMHYNAYYTLDKSEYKTNRYISLLLIISALPFSYAIPFLNINENQNDLSNAVNFTIEHSLYNDTYDFIAGVFCHLTPLGVLYLIYFSIKQYGNDCKQINKSDSPIKSDVLIKYTMLTLNLVKEIVIDVLLYPLLAIAFIVRLCSSLCELCPSFLKESDNTNTP